VLYGETLSRDPTAFQCVHVPTLVILNVDGYLRSRSVTPRGSLKVLDVDLW
jgi:hypothetical protein